MKIAEKTILITGANRGIGHALVLEALRRGANRVYAGTRGGFDIADVRVVPITLDVTDDAQIEQAVQATGDLGLLINNSGIAPYDDLSKPDPPRRGRVARAGGSTYCAREPMDNQRLESTCAPLAA